MDEGFTLWKIIRKENELPVFRGENGNHLFVHILVLSGELKAEWTGILYPLTKNSFADFIDGRSLEIRDISEDIQAYVLFFFRPVHRLPDEKYSAVPAFVYITHEGMACICTIF